MSEGGPARPEGAPAHGDWPRDVNHGERPSPPASAPLPARRRDSAAAEGCSEAVRHAERVGWGMFIVSAVLFGWSGARSGDLLVVAGSVVFGLACVLFLLPVRGGRPDDDIEAG